MTYEEYIKGFPWFTRKVLLWLWSIEVTEDKVIYTARRSWMKEKRLVYRKLNP